MRPQPANRSEQAYQRLAEELIGGRWQPGDTLSTYALAEELGFSRTPIIQALKRLETEGLVQIIPQVGCRVIAPSSAAIEELYSLRGALDGLAAETAASKMSERDLRELKLVVSRMDVAAEESLRERYAELNQEFHHRIMQASGKPRVAQISAGIWSDLRFQLARQPMASDLIVESQAEHHALYDALEERSARKARSAAEKHARLSGKRFLAHLERNPVNDLGLSEPMSRPPVA
jgi:DNA-binding GntR family transcriptional regulator